MYGIVAAILLLFVGGFAQNITKSYGWKEAAMVEFEAIDGASEYKLYYSGEGLSNVPVDPQLIRNYGSYWRGDVLGLKPGTYSLKVTAVVNGTESAGSSAEVTVSAHDRSGFAFANGVVPGAYKADGTLKENAVVLYATANTINTLSMDVVDATVNPCVGLQNIFDGYKKGKDPRPLVVRIIGQVGIPENNQSGDLVVENKNNAHSYITIEGVGKDAVMDGWGLRVKNANNVEVRNLGIMNVSSNEGDNIGLQQNNEHVWVHHIDMFYGHAGSDGDQQKGDGALDCKKSTYVTFAYNHFWDTGKSSLLGLSEGTTERLYITYHHNWFDHSDSRHPRVRYYSAHVYNNYYDGISKYGAGSTMGSSIFMESNYFRNTRYPMLISMQGSDVYDASKGENDYKNKPTFSKEDGGIIKAYNNHIEGEQRFVAYGDVNFPNSTVDFDAYMVNTAGATVPSSVKSDKGDNIYNNFDTDANMYAYTADSPEEAKNKVIAQAGRMEGGDFRWTFDNAVDDKSYAVNAELKSALNNYKTKLLGVQGEASQPQGSSSSTEQSSSSDKSSSQESSSSSKQDESDDKDEGESTSLLPITTSLLHNFSTQALESEYLYLSGNLSKSKGTLNYNEMVLTQCLKLESNTQITMQLAQASTLKLYLNAYFTGKVKIDGKNHSATAGVISLDLDEGEHSITKADVANLFLLEITVENPTFIRKVPTFAKFHQGRILLDSGARDLQIFNLHGQLQSSYEKPGYYIVKYQLNGKSLQQLFLVK